MHNEFSEKLVTVYFLLVPMRFIRYHTYRIEKFVRKAALEMDLKGRVILDVGAGTGVYGKYFNHCNYLLQDVQQNARGTVNFVCDITDSAQAIPSELADAIITTQVLEHIRDPQVAFHEFARILKPGGKVFLTTHMAFELHMKPNDYFRYTKYGLAYLGERAGLKMTQYDTHGGVFQLLNYLIGTLPIRLFCTKREGIFYYTYLAIATPLLILSGAIAELLDKIDRYREITLNMECEFSKPNQ
jgi:ubiquinone/menaquinone biosynthesis C-methylase UbiE